MENETKKRIEKCKIEMNKIKESNPQMSQFLSIEHGATVRTIREIKDFYNSLKTRDNVPDEIQIYILDCLNAE